MSSCLEWTKALNKDGYGQTTINGKTARVHRIAWIKAHGSIQKGMCVCHTCDNPKCYNIEHLFLGTIRENAIDRQNKNRGNQAKGEKVATAKLREFQVIEIREKYKTKKYTLRDLSQEYNVDASTLGSLIRRETWKHI